MIRRKNKLYLLGGLNFLFLALMLYSCNNKVTITQEYIYSDSWSRGGYQGFQIQKIKLKDSTLNVFDEDFNHYFLDQHSVDSSFCFIEITETDRTLTEKIYFDEESPTRKWRNCWNGINDVRKTIGYLELDTWYMITGLYGTEDFYVYIDNEGASHTYSLGPTNW